MATDPSRAKSIFLTAAERPPGEPRAAYLADACGPDADLRREVDDLLAHFEWVGSFMESPNAAPAVEALPAQSVGTRIGPYKLVEVIGEGGMGAVWLAQQTEPVKRLVALKVIKAGMDSAQVIARFEAEQQALALMDHPNIAKVLDAGTTEGGRPFFAMELVKGVPITRYCDEHHLTPRQRLELFVPVCQAIQHAHQKGVIHRDLKPSNVLVAPYDGIPVPKVIDFGVAKAMSQPLTDRTLVTGLGAVVGTLEYMSPEQAELNNLDVDTRSDIYSLGVVLYELLTGTTPLQRDRLKQGALLEMLRVIREEEPPRPSTRLSTTEELPGIAANRGLEPRRLSGLVRGDLDLIVMKCLEKDRARRYATANGLALDLERYLRDEPVQACPPSAGYRLRKFVRRNKRAVMTAASLGLMLLVAIGAVAGSIGWAARDRRVRDSETDRQVETALRDAERLRDRGSWTDARVELKRVEWLLADGKREHQRERLQAIAADLDMVARLDELRLRPFVSTRPGEDRREIEDYFAAFRAYGIDLKSLDPDEAAQRVRNSAIREELICALDDWTSIPLLIRFPVGWNKIKALVNESPRAAPAVEREEKLKRAAPLPTVARLADPDDWRNRVRDSGVLNDRAALEALAGQPSAAARRPSTALLLARALYSVGAKEKSLEVLFAAQQQSPTDLSLNLQLADHLRKDNRFAEAVGFARAALVVRSDHPAMHVRLGECLLWAGHAEQALASLGTALALGRDDAAIHFSIGEAHIRQGTWAEAEAALRRSLVHNPNSTRTYLVLGWVHRNTRAWDQAIAAHEQAVRFTPKSAEASTLLAWVVASRPDAEPHEVSRAVELARIAIAAHPEVRDNWIALGVAQYRAGDWPASITAMDTASRMPNGGGPYEWFFLAMAHCQLGDRTKARDFFARAVRVVNEKPAWLEGNPVKKEELDRFRVEAARLIGGEIAPVGSIAVQTPDGVTLKKP